MERDVKQFASKPRYVILGLPEFNVRNTSFDGEKYSALKKVESLLYTTTEYLSNTVEISYNRNDEIYVLMAKINTLYTYI